MLEPRRGRRSRDDRARMSVVKVTRPPSEDTAAPGVLSQPQGAPMSQRPPDVQPEVMQGDLTEEALNAYLRGREIAADTETMGLQTLRDRLCAVQLCDRHRRAAPWRIPPQPDPGRPPAGS